MNRSLRNIIARALMEGYDETYDQYRFALLSADLVIATLKENREVALTTLKGRKIGKAEIVVGHTNVKLGFDTWTFPV